MAWLMLPGFPWEVSSYFSSRPRSGDLRAPVTNPWVSTRALLHCPHTALPAWSSDVSPLTFLRSDTTQSAFCLLSFNEVQLIYKVVLV